MPSPLPFLTLPERVEYLRQKGYLFGSNPTQAAQDRLATLNFHYFLGYARNYRQLASRGVVSTDDVLGSVLDLIDCDRHLSVAVFHALRKLEWKLRALLVEHHCGMFPATGCYLEEAHYKSFNPELPDLHLSLARHIERSREPFILDHFAAGNRAQDLPIWATVDTWTFSDLSRVISESVPLVDPAGGPDRRLWREVALSLGVSAQTIQGNLQAIAVLRNLVAHHARLWMRPIALMPKIPKYYPTSLRHSIDQQSLYGVFLALAEMLNPKGEGTVVLADIDAILAVNPVFKLGVRNPVSKVART